MEMHENDKINPQVEKRQNAFLIALDEKKGEIEEALLEIGVSYRTFNRWLCAYPELEKKVDEVMAEHHKIRYKESGERNFYDKVRKNFPTRLRKNEGNILKTCESFGIAYQPYYNWTKTHPEFKEECEKIISLFNERQEELKQIKEAFPEVLRRNFGIKTKACEELGIHISFVTNWIDNDENFAAACKEALEYAHDFVENQLFTLIRNGDVASTIFYCKTRLRHRGYTEKQVEQEIKVINNINNNHVTEKEREILDRYVEDKMKYITHDNKVN